jgi:hypothetical protein
LLGAKKRQNKITEYREMLLAWKKAGVITYAGYILGFPHDTVESIMHDIDVIKRELPVDLLEFFYLTPLPGSEDHLKLKRAGALLDPDMNKYDLNHICTTHPKMSREEWDRAYKMAWQRYYTIDHIETIMRRVAASRANASNALFLITWFMGSINYEHIHPLESGLIRLKYRRDRRPGLAIEPMWSFYPKYFAEMASKVVRWGALYLRLRRIYLRIKHDPRRFDYTDLATTPVAADETETHELFGTDAARAYVARTERVKEAQAGHTHDVLPMEAAE